MNEQDQRTLYTAMSILGMLVQGINPRAVAEMTKILVDEVLKEEEK